MKTEVMVAAKFDELVKQRDSATIGSAARSMLNQRLQALGWVLNNPMVPELRMGEAAFGIYDCVG